MNYVYDVETTLYGFVAVFINVTEPINEIENKLKEHYDKSILYVLKTYFHTIDCKIFQINSERNDIVALYQFLYNHQGYLIGFNNNHFDNLIINFLCKCTHYFIERYNKRGDIIALAAYTISQVIILKDNYFKNGKYKSDIIFDLINQFEKLTRGDIMLGLLKSNNSQEVYKNWFLKDLLSYNRTYISIDLMTLGLETVERKSLKAISIILRWCRIQDMPHKHNEKLNSTQLKSIIGYCFNDVLITLKLYNYLKEVLQTRLDIIALEKIKDKYTFETYISANKAKLGDLYGERLYAKYTNLKSVDFTRNHTSRDFVKFVDIISSKIKFATTPFIELLNQVRNTTITNDYPDFSYRIICNNTIYDMKKGGLHSVDKPGVFFPTDDYFLIDYDKDSFYPRIIQREEIEPAHLQSGVFHTMAGDVIEERIVAKHDFKRATEAYQKKILLNSWFFGKLMFDGSWTKDIQAGFKVTINGQLYLLMIIEKLEMNGIHVISANTDGFTALVPKDKYDKYLEITKYYQTYFNITGEYTNYILYVRKNVNDYIAISDKKVKQKGSSFLTETDISKSYGFPIRAKALISYFKDKIPIGDTIYNNNDIFDFLLTQKMSDTYTPYLYSIKNGILHKEEQQKNIRYFVSKSGGILYKERGKEKQRVIKNGYITTFNNYYPKDNIKDYGIYYPYYITETKKIIEAIEKQIDIENVTTSSDRFKKYTKRRKPTKADNNDINNYKLWQ